MGFTVYKSTDGSAPALSGTAGALITVLDGILVNGYGAQSAAGWAKTYSGTNKAAYTQGSGSNGMLLRVQDDAGGTGGAKEALLRGFEAMTTVDAGTGPFPTDPQSALTSDSVVCRKSASADATARAWIAVADSRTVYFFVLTTDVASTYLAFAFGEFYSLVNSDAYRCMIIGRTSENSAAGSVEKLDTLSAYNAAVTGHFFARGHTGTGGSVAFGKHANAAIASTSVLGAGNAPYTNPADGGLYLCPVWITDPTTTPANGLRGRMRGFWGFCHAVAGVADLDTFSGTGDLAGKTFLILKTSGNSGCYIIETSNTLESN